METGESYKVLKAISKKKLDVIRTIEDQFVERLTTRYGESDDTYNAISALLRQIIDSSAYALVI